MQEAHHLSFTIIQHIINLCKTAPWDSLLHTVTVCISPLVDRLQSKTAPWRHSLNEESFTHHSERGAKNKIIRWYISSYSGWQMFCRRRTYFSKPLARSADLLPNSTRLLQWILQIMSNLECFQKVVSLPLVTFHCLLCTCLPAK